MSFTIEVSEAAIRREKARARVLRQSAWWKRRLAAGRCEYCDRPARPRDLTMDHRVPLIRGGRSLRSNLVPACKACNTAKRYLLPTEWADYLTRLAEKNPWTSEPSAP